MMKISEAQKRVLLLMNEGWVLKDIQHSTTVKEICLSKDGHLPRFLHHLTLPALFDRHLIEIAHYGCDEISIWQLTKKGQEIVEEMK